MGRIWDLEAIGPNGFPFDIFGQEIKPLTEEQKAEMGNLMNCLKEMMKDMDIKFVMPDLSSLEERAAAFAASAQLWDDRVLGADEEYVEVCSDPEVEQIARQISQERLEEAKRVIVLGSGPSAVGSLTGAILASLQSKHGGTYFDIEHIPAPVDRPPTFLDYEHTKLHKGKGHNKFKKKKKK